MMTAVRRIQTPSCPLGIGNDDAPESQESSPPWPPVGLTGGGGTVPVLRFSVNTGITSQFSPVSVLSSDRCRYSLRNKVFPFARHAVIERPAIHCGKLFSKITMTRRCRRSPLQSSRVPRISFSHGLPAEDAEEEVEQENQLGRSQHECGNGNENVHRLLWLKEHVLSRVIDAPHL